MFPASINRYIDDNLQNIVVDIETKNHNLFVFLARQFRYSCSQNQVELKVKESRQFNVLEEFIIRAGIEFETPPTPTELASVLGLDIMFINNTIANLQSLQTLSLEPVIKVTDEGNLFYQQGTVPQTPYSVNVYAISDYLTENLTFISDGLDNVSVQLPELNKFAEDAMIGFNFANWELSKIQKIIEDSGLNFHIPSDGKLVTDFQVTSPPKKIWQSVDMLVIFDAQKDIFNIQLRQGKNILTTASQKLNSLLHKDKIDIAELCQLSDENIKLARTEIIST
ncbi:MAG: hypothetical protein F6K62_09670 [Sphaerospermopsis sp. SIO1G2]|nr:hypothetical protein [Sphaerospermopsis sp. SIO1G2]